MEDRIRTLRQALSGMREIRFAYLFGQRVNGGAGELSEFGVAAYLSARCPAFDQRLDMMERLSGVLGTTDFDFVVLNDAPVLTNRSIVRHGVVVKDDPDARDTFQTRLHQIGYCPAVGAGFWSFNAADLAEMPILAR